MKAPLDPRNTLRRSGGGCWDLGSCRLHTHKTALSTQVRTGLWKLQRERPLPKGPQLD